MKESCSSDSTKTIPRFPVDWALATKSICLLLAGTLTWPAQEETQNYLMA